MGQGIQRGSRQRKKYHIKDLFCLQCACVTKCIELRWCDDYEKVMEQADKLHKEIYEGDIWEFKKNIEGRQFYVKLKIQSRNGRDVLKCLTFQ